MDVTWPKSAGNRARSSSTQKDEDAGGGLGGAGVEANEGGEEPEEGVEDDGNEGEDFDGERSTSA